MFVIAVRSFGIIGGGAVLFGASAIVGQTILPALGEVLFCIILRVDFFQDWERQHWHLGQLVQPALLPSASLGQDNVAYLVPDGGEGLSVQDHVKAVL